jgi:hypothetical protein
MLCQLQNLCIIGSEGDMSGESERTVNSFSMYPSGIRLGWLK